MWLIDTKSVYVSQSRRQSSGWLRLSSFDSYPEVLDSPVKLCLGLDCRVDSLGLTAWLPSWRIVSRLRSPLVDACPSSPNIDGDISCTRYMLSVRGNESARNAEGSQRNWRRAGP